MHQHQFTRRQLLTGLGSTALLSFLGKVNAFAQSAPPDYKALVCIFLSGGNDSHNMVVPLNGPDYTAYKTARGSLALPDLNGAMVNIVNTDGKPYGLNPGLLALQPLWNQGALAILANAVPVPTNLFSHSDQVQQIQTGIPSTSGGTGWGGRAADVIKAFNGTTSFPSALSVAGPSLFCKGSVVQGASIVPGLGLDMWGMDIWPQEAASARKAGLQQILQFNSGLELIQVANNVRKDAVDMNTMLSGSGASLGTAFPGTGIGKQLQQVAQIIKLRTTTGMSRQVFFCTLDGFDTHSAQSWTQWDLLRQLAEGLAAFYNATMELGVADRVTSFTLSDFGRTLEVSGSGSDHGWGGHHLILGGAVQGGRIHGTFPTLALGGPDDANNRGVLIPTTSIDQYGATLASWLGVPAAQLATVFPNLAKFPTQTLGFMKA